MDYDHADMGDELQKSDEALILEVRTGSETAYASLYERHIGSARSTAYRHAGNTSDAEDLVSDGFANVLHTIKLGKGPTVFFRAYLLTTIRRLASAKRAASNKAVPTDDLERVEPVVHAADPAVVAFDQETVARSFNGLPERWQAVLWHTEIDGLTPAAVAPILGMTPNAVSALALRAREGLKQAYLQNHLSSLPSDGCAAYTDQLGAYARNGLTPRRTKKVRQHVDSCLRCTEMLLHLEDVGTGMRAIVFPTIMGLIFVGSGATSAAGLGLHLDTGGAGAGSGVTAGGVAAGAGSMSLTTFLVASVASVVLVGAVVASAVGLSNMGVRNATTQAASGAVSESPAVAAPSGNGSQSFSPPSLMSSIDEPIVYVGPERSIPAPTQEGTVPVAPEARQVESPLDPAVLAGQLGGEQEAGSVRPPSVEPSKPKPAQTSSATASMTLAPKPSPSATAPQTAAPSAEPTVAPSVSPKPTPSAIPSHEPPTPTPEPTTPEPTTPAPTPTPEPTTPTPTPDPTAEPTTPAPTPEATTPAPTPEPTTPAPTPEPPVLKTEFLAEPQGLASVGEKIRLSVDLTTVGNVAVEAPEVIFASSSWLMHFAVDIGPPPGWVCGNSTIWYAPEWTCTTAQWSGELVSFELSVPMARSHSSLDMSVVAQDAEKLSTKLRFK